MPLVKQTARMSTGGRSPRKPKEKAATPASGESASSPVTRRRSSRLSGKVTDTPVSTTTGTTSPYFKKTPASGSRKRKLQDTDEDKK